MSGPEPKREPSVDLSEYLGRALAPLLVPMAATLADLALELAAMRVFLALRGQIDGVEWEAHLARYRMEHLAEFVETLALRLQSSLDAASPPPPPGAG